MRSRSNDLAFNTAASFTTNTNWQKLTRLDRVSQDAFSRMAAITFLMSISATTGVAAAGGFIRGLSRTTADIGGIGPTLRAFTM